MDVGSRTVVPEKVEEVNDTKSIGAGTEGNDGDSKFENMMVKLERELKEMMQKGFDNMMVKFDDLDTRLKAVEKFVFPPDCEDRTYGDVSPIYQPYHPSPIYQPSGDVVLYQPSGDVVLYSGVPDPIPPIIMDITEEEDGQKEKKGKGKKEKTKRKAKEPSVTPIATGVKRRRGDSNWLKTPWVDEEKNKKKKPEKK